ncbi:MAG TPA: MBL fold metallo-hydrolase, partial [Frankiaceae bacterium]|nr:MBL fold metallo-hydrolase [Frankiaceae bacterium]
ADWDLGEGRTISCGPGTPWHPEAVGADGGLGGLGAPSPDCDYRFARGSGDGTYQATVRSVWRVSWQASDGERGCCRTWSARPASRWACASTRRSSSDEAGMSPRPPRAGAHRLRPLTAADGGPAAHGVLVATSRLYATTTTAVVHDDRVLLVDPALFPDELAALAADVHTRRWTVEAALATHAHWDHLLWTPELGDVPRYASPPTVELARTERVALLAEMAAALDEPWPDEVVAGFGAVTPFAADRVPWSGPDAWLLVHDAHARGHTAVWLPDRGVLLAGDMLSDVEVPLLDLAAPDPVGGYRTGLERLAGLDVRLVVPGHGRPGGAAAYRRRLDADRRYLDAVGSGRQPADPRLADPALRREHERALAALAHRRRPTP